MILYHWVGLMSSLGLGLQKKRSEECDVVRTPSAIAALKMEGSASHIVLAASRSWRRPVAD